jgi:hypothetical protein
MASTQCTPLAGISGWTQEFIDKLNEGWITSAEQVVELAATPQGLTALGEHLSITTRHARQLVEAAGVRLDVDAVATSRQRARPRKYRVAGLPSGDPPEEPV